MLAHLTKISSSKVKNKCTKIKQDAFDEIKRITARNNLLQLGAVISQKVKPIYFYSITLTGSQRIYTVI